jgi:hypothetical protein
METIPENEASPPIETSDFFKTVGAAILKSDNPNQASLKEAFQRFVLRDFLPSLERRIVAIEAALDAQDLAHRRAAMTAIPGNPKAIRVATVKARRAARKHFSIVEDEP